MIDYVQGSGSFGVSEAENLFDGKRGAKRYGRIIRRNMANVRMTQTQLVRSLAEKLRSQQQGGSRHSG